jgi:hypothetical protein
MVLEADTIPILIDDFASIIHRRILVDNDGHRLQHIHEKHTEKQTDQKRQQL